MRYLKHESTLYSVAPVGLALMPSKCASGKRFGHDGRTQRGEGGGGPKVSVQFYVLFLIDNILNISPKMCTRSFNLNAKNAKTPWCGRGETPLTHPPPARALRALACVVPRLKQIILHIRKKILHTAMIRAPPF